MKERTGNNHKKFLNMARVGLATLAFAGFVESACAGDESTPPLKQPPATSRQIPPQEASTLTAEPTVTSTPTIIPTLEPTPTLTSTPTLEPTAIPILTPRPSPTSTRVPTLEPTPTSTPEAKVENINFVFGERVSQEEQEEIRDSAIIARDWFIKAGVEIGDIHIFSSANPAQVIDEYLKRTIFPQQRNEAQGRLKNATAFAGEKKDLFIITSSAGWVSASPIVGGPVNEGRTHTIFHEVFHVWQREAGGYNGDFPHWLNEGGAHYIAARGLDDSNLYPYGKIREGHLREAANVREDLKLMESAQGFYSAGSPYADEYSLGFLAVELLVKDLQNEQNEDVQAIAKFWQEIGKGIPWPTAFQTSFGKTVDQFYAEFESFRQQGFH